MRVRTGRGQYNEALEDVLDAAGNLVRAKRTASLHQALGQARDFADALAELTSAVQRAEMTGEN